MSVYNITQNYDETGKLQHSLKTKDVVLCICYQPPNLQYKHPKTGDGTYSQAVYVVGGSYTCVPAFRASGIDRDTVESDVIRIKKGEFVNLEHLRNITTYDTAGPDGVMMIHVNPMSGKSEYNFEFIGPNETKEIVTADQRKIVFCFKEEVYVNDVELSLLNRVRLKHNTITTIETGSTGACLVLERRSDI